MLTGPVASAFALLPSLPPGFAVAAAAIAALLLVLAVGRPVIRHLLRLKFRDGDCRKDSAMLAKLHAEAGKSGTPTMGGVMIVVAFVGAVLIFAPLSPPVLAGVGLVLAFGGLGMIDDRVKLLGRRDGRDGLRGRTKLLLELAIAGAAAMVLAVTSPLGPDAQASVTVPGIGAVFALGAWYLPLAMLVIVGTANAANLTDGLDGLASGVVAVAAVALAVGALLAGATGEAVFAAALAGACAGFLFFNAWPARVFMGDTGSLAIGAGLGYAALLLKQELVLAVVGGVLVAEALSVILQVGVFKLTRKRVFRCAPLHHHFQFAGVSEPRIVRRFWLAGLLLAAAGLALGAR